MISKIYNAPSTIARKRYRNRDAVFEIPADKQRSRSHPE